MPISAARISVSAEVGVRVGHLVILVERRDVPGNVGADRGEEAGRLAQLVVAVVEARNDEGDDLQPQAALVDHADGARDVVQRAAEAAIVAVVELFEIDLVGDDPGAEIIEHFRRGVAVGDEGAGQPGRLRLAEDATAHSAVMSGSL